MKSIQPDQNSLSATDFCRGLPAGDADGHYSLKCKSSVDIRFSRSLATWRSHCNFAGLVTPFDTLAVDFRSGSSGGWEFPAAYPSSAQVLNDFGGDAQYTGVTLYSRTDFVIGKDRLPAGLYKLFPHKDDQDWILDFAAQDGEWDQLLPVEHPAWHARMNSIHGTDARNNPVADILVRPRSCPASSPLGPVRELEFSFGTQDISVCVTLIPGAPSAPDEVSKR
ncbi:MAG TPA: hypothetical protein VGJ21_09395 [Terracidiphilus sp.]